MKKVRLGLVDDQKLFRESLANLLESVPEYELVLQSENGMDCLNQLKTVQELPDILLMDMEMSVMDGIELNAYLHKQYPGIKKIILSVYAKERLMARMINAGANAYLVKNCDRKELCTAINSVHENGFYMNLQVMKAIQNASASKNTVIKSLGNIPIELTPREIEILQYICKEYSNAEIAAALFLSVRTVEGHRNNLLMKTGCKNTAGLALFAVKYRIYEILF